MNSLRSVSISRRLWLILIVAVVMLLTLGVLMLKQIHDDLYHAKAQKTQHVVQTASGLLTYYHDLETAGTLTRDAAQNHEALLCVQTGKTLSDPNRFKFDGDGYYLKSAAEMREIWRDFPEACDNTLLIAERCNVEFKERELMPRFPVPEGHTEASWFEQEVAAGMQRRYKGQIPEAQAKQVSYEVEVIEQMGFPGYFLVVADFIAWARAQGIRVGPGRGSAAGWSRPATAVRAAGHSARCPACRAWPARPPGRCG